MSIAIQPIKVHPTRIVRIQIGVSFFALLVDAMIAGKKYNIRDIKISSNIKISICFSPFDLVVKLSKSQSKSQA